MREGGGQKEGKKETLPLTSICVQVRPPLSQEYVSQNRRNGTDGTRSAPRAHGARALSVLHAH